MILDPKWVVGLLLILFVCPGGWAAEPPAKPNIVVILADDLGYGDVQIQTDGQQTDGQQTDGEQTDGVNPLFAGKQWGRRRGQPADWCKLQSSRTRRRRRLQQSSG